MSHIRSRLVRRNIDAEENHRKLKILLRFFIFCRFLRRDRFLPYHPHLVNLHHPHPFSSNHGQRKFYFSWQAKSGRIIYNWPLYRGKSLKNKGVRCMEKWGEKWKERRMEWMNEWMNEWASERASERASEWVSEWVSEWMNEWMNEWIIRTFTHSLGSFT